MPHDERPGRTTVERARDLGGCLLMASATARANGGAIEISDSLLLEWAQEAAAIASRAEDELFDRLKGPPPGKAPTGLGQSFETSTR